MRRSLFLCCALAACTSTEYLGVDRSDASGTSVPDTGLALADGGPLADASAPTPDLLTVEGRVCTTPVAKPNPVKIVLLVDQSGSMCVSDGPGSQSSMGFCEAFGSTLISQGITQPGRVKGLLALLEVLRRRPEVSVAVVPFSLQVQHSYPSTGFVSAGSVDDHVVIQLQSDLGRGSDPQGALAEAHARIAADIDQTIAAGRREELARTRYVVLLLTDGMPYPRCALVDSGPFASVAAPDGVWPDNPVTTCNDACTGSPPAGNSPECLGETCGKPDEGPDAGCDPAAGEVPSGFVRGGERNQPHQLFEAAQALRGLRARGVGDVQLHTALLFHSAAIKSCGAVCLHQLYGGMDAEDARLVAVWTLGRLAAFGGGTFQQFNDHVMDFTGLDFGSLGQPELGTLLVRNASAVPSASGPLPDTDVDGLSDAAEVAAGSNPLLGDTDGDGFGDAFEAARASEGFDPLVLDRRGCKEWQGVAPRFGCADQDGDGLSEASEAYLGTDPLVGDTDLDGILDGLEVVLGLNPLVRNDASVDTDRDGLTDLSEVLGHTHPAVADASRAPLDSYVRSLGPAETQQDGSRCYRFQVSRIRLVPTQGGDGLLAHADRVDVLFSEGPPGAPAVAWHHACVLAASAAPGKDGPRVTLAPTDFHSLPLPGVPECKVASTP